MPSTRTIHTLTEAWPQDPANFELQAFAATLVEERPALGAPALDRIQSQLAAELDRRTRSPDVRPSRWIRVAGKMVPAGRVLAPYAAAACLLVAAGVWMSSLGSKPSPSPMNPNGSLITDQPKSWQPPEPEDAARQSKPAPTGG